VVFRWQLCSRGAPRQGTTRYAGREFAPRENLNGAGYKLSCLAASGACSYLALELYRLLQGGHCVVSHVAIARGSELQQLSEAVVAIGHVILFEKVGDPRSNCHAWTLPVANVMPLRRPYVFYR
jgi:hypothetical protein